MLPIGPTKDLNFGLPAFAAGAAAERGALDFHDIDSNTASVPLATFMDQGRRHEQLRAAVKLHIEQGHDSGDALRAALEAQ